MRNRTPDSNTAPNPADSWFWFITEKGLRASGAASMRSTAASLRKQAAELERSARRLDQEMPAPPDGEGEMTPLSSRRGTVCYRYRNENQVPDLRLSGQWLERAGFDRGRKFQIQVHAGRLTLRAEPTVEH